ncbi:hypothetical protein D3C77_735420 [compost metagenome]
MSPTIGSLSTERSTKSRNFCERLWASLNRKPAAKKPASRISQYSCSASDRPMTISVKAGSSAPKLANTDWNCGTTLISRIAETMIATSTTAIG